VVARGQGTPEKNSVRQKRLPIAVAAVIAAVGLASLQVVPSGKVGLAETDGSYDLLGHGLHLRPPWNRATIYPVEPDGITVKVSAQTPGGQFVAELEIEISLDPDGVASLHRSYRGRHVENLISPLISDYMRRCLDVFGGYSSEGNNAGIEQGILGNLTASLDPYGIKTHAVRLRSLDQVVNDQDVEIIETAERYGGKVVIIGSDAFDWQIYQEISRQRPMPNIEKLIAEGATGDLISIEPLVSPMIWTTMATGVEPHIHGIIDFLMKDEQTGEDVPITSTIRRVPALWNILTRFGLKSGFIGWLGSYPAEPVSGFVVSDRIVYHTFDPRWRDGTYEDFAHDNVAGLTYPEQLIQEIRAFLTGYEDVSYSVLRNYVNVEPEDITSGAKTFDSLDPIRNLRLIIAANTTYEKIADYAYRKYSPDLLAVYLDMVDTICHLFIKHMEPPTSDVSPEDVAKYGGAVAAAYAHTDSLIGAWLQVIDDETTIVLVSDHGFKSGPVRHRRRTGDKVAQADRCHRSLRPSYQEGR
jgi:hypothetical protein